MITHLKGQLIEKTPTYVVVECNGIGYYVHISLITYTRLQENAPCHLFTHLVVREDAHLLYGFSDKEERQLFRHLISVSGVGATTAMVMLSSLSHKEIQQAIVGNDVNLLKSIKGIGAKTAERIIVDLKDKLGKVDLSGNISPSLHNTKREEALSALIMLGFNKNFANTALDKIIRSEGNELTVEQLIKLALKYL